MKWKSNASWLSDRTNFDPNGEVLLVYVTPMYVDRGILQSLVFDVVSLYIIVQDTNP